jgi:thiol-disulfide isomerase/thioredoxin
MRFPHQGRGASWAGVVLMAAVLAAAAGCPRSTETVHGTSDLATMDPDRVDGTTADPAMPENGPGDPHHGLGGEGVHPLSGHPYLSRFDVEDLIHLRVEEFPRDMEWINTAAPLRLRDLRGKFVLLDFWTYCCINCIHVIPELKKLEKAYPDQLVVIGVHSAKFDTERDSRNIREAVLRYEVVHPVVNDADHVIWDAYGVSSWPTLLLIDPEGYAVWGRPGEVKFEELDALLRRGLPYYRERKLLDESPLHFDLAIHQEAPTPLRFPGKVLADEASDRLYISDSNHNRIVVTTLAGKLVEIIGKGTMGQDDGDYATATFGHPQGMALDGNAIYVADTANHLIRKVDLAARRVATIAGTGAQGRRAWPGIEKIGPFGEPPDRWIGKPLETAINSPWDLYVKGSDLYIAMAGPHQIWKLSQEADEIGPYAGNGGEDIVDGPLLPKYPHDPDYASFAQPSGLASDGQWLFVADSEGSSIRAVPFDPEQHSRTVVGTADKPFARLFEFGDADGALAEGKLQHPLGVAWHGGKLYVADTYNNKIKVIDEAADSIVTLAGTGEAGRDDEAPSFDEPSGLAYAGGKLYVADTNGNKVGTLVIEGLAAPAPSAEPRKPDFSTAKQVDVAAVRLRPDDGAVTLNVKLALPEGWKINALAPMSYALEVNGGDGPVDRQATGRLVRLDAPSAEFAVRVPVGVSGSESLRLGLNYFFCQDGNEGLCKVGSIVWTVPLEISPGGGTSSATLEGTAGL